MACIAGCPVETIEYGKRRRASRVTIPATHKLASDAAMYMFAILTGKKSASRLLKDHSQPYKIRPFVTAAVLRTLKHLKKTKEKLYAYGYFHSHRVFLFPVRLAQVGFPIILLYGSLPIGRNAFSVWTDQLPRFSAASGSCDK